MELSTINTRHNVCDLYSVTAMRRKPMLASSTTISSQANNFHTRVGCFVIRLRRCMDSVTRRIVRYDDNVNVKSTQHRASIATGRAFNNNILAHPKTTHNVSRFTVHDQRCDEACIVVVATAAVTCFVCYWLSSVVTLLSPLVVSM